MNMVMIIYIYNEYGVLDLIDNIGLEADVNWFNLCRNMMKVENTYLFQLWT